MNGAEELRRSARKKNLCSASMDNGYFYGDYFDSEEASLPDPTLVVRAVLDENGVPVSEGSREEEFLAAVLLMIKKDELPPQWSSDEASKFEYFSQACEEHQWNRVVCPRDCPRRKIDHLVKSGDEDNLVNDMDTGSSSLDEENGIRYPSDGASESDELFDDLHYRAHDERKILSARFRTPKKQPMNRTELTEAYPASLKVRAAGAKRKIEDADMVQPKRKYSKQRKVIKGIEMFWNPPTESYGIAKPKTPQQYEEVVRWSLAQLPRKSGTTEEVFVVVKEFGWPELKKGNTREALISRNTISKILFEQFLVKGQNEHGESVYCSEEAFDEDMEGNKENASHGMNHRFTEEDFTRGMSSCSKHMLEEGCSVDCSFRASNFLTRRRRDIDLEDRLRERRAREDRKSKRDGRRKSSALSDESAEDGWYPTGSPTMLENPLSVPGRKKSLGVAKRATGTPKENGGRGRRWVRFACEKHRREHARCPDNCPMRKKSYTDDTNNDDEVDENGFDEDSRSVGEDDVVVDENSTEVL